MRRALLAILLVALTASAPAAWAATSPETIRAILRDCEDDGALSGSYRPSELRDAVRNIGTDLDQYSDCRDVINAAVVRGVSRPGPVGGGGGGGGVADGSRPDAGGAPGASGLTGGEGAEAGFGTGGLLTPDGPEEVAELSRLRTAPPPSAVVGGRPVPVAAKELATIAAHDLPAPLLVALALLTLGALVAGLPPLRRRVLDRRAA